MSPLLSEQYTTTHPKLLHQFESLDQQREASLLGVWAFLATEVLFFGALFLAYTLYRHTYPDAFRVGSSQLSVALGCFNTAVLIGSSLTMALAVAGAQRGNRRAVTGFLIATILLGGVFLGVKAIEWTHDYEEELIPGIAFSHERWERAGVAAAHGELFFVLYFSMTGLHAAHMVAGMGVMACLLRPAWRGRYAADYYTPIEGLGLYWHFVDIVWIFLFPLYYLIGTRVGH